MPNRLIHEDSPYLQQHADNPVDWWPWCDEAFQKARKENKPIFLSIGYSSCHWCHVMEHEVFENEKIAEYLNAHFVSIKVDREERPDIDKYYQSVHQLLNQRPGGWPLSIFMTPDKKPFFAGTYIPPTRKYNMMGFLELIEVIDKKWRQAPQDIVKNADEIQRYLAPNEGPVKATRLDESLIEKVLKQAEDIYDPEWGGFSKAPKFPHTSTIDLLLDLYLLKHDEKALNMAVHTLKMMSLGGFYDLVDGGFCRYSTDETWLVPHFEKMTYDNGLLLQSYLKAWRITRRPLFLEVAEEIIDFMGEKMMEQNLFYSASDADSEGMEGKYFVYDYDEVLKALEQEGYGEKEAIRICKELNLTPKGNFEGKNIVRFTTPDRPLWWPKVRKILQNLRNERAYPFIDKKVITAWNAMMIEGLFLAGLENPRHLDQARQSLDALLATMWPDETDLYHSTLIGKAPKIEAFLEDYAYLASALIRAYETTLEEDWLQKAQKVAEIAITRFYEGGEWYFSRGEFPTQADLGDGSYPSSAAVMVRVLQDLGDLVDAKYHAISFKSIEFASLKIARYPVYHPAFTDDTIRHLKEAWVVKGLPPMLKKVREKLSPPPHPWILYKNEIRPDLIACNCRSCFAQGKSAEELIENLQKMH